MSKQKGWAGNFFEDFGLEQSVPCPTPRALTHGEIAQYIAMTCDRSPRFCGADGRIHPLLLFHQVLGQTVRHVSLNAFANLGYAELRWHRPVYAGVEVHTRAEVIGLKENSSGKSGIVYVRTTGCDQEGNTLLSFVRWVMVRKRDAAPTRWRAQPVVPTLESVVDPASLSLPDPPTRPQADARWCLSDYTVGERIFHMDGHTVNSADHMAFTRLFQNSARVHFDARLTEGRPLVFGGYVMSIGYAQAHNGMNSRLGIAAINGGTHANPVHAGDTLYSFTEIRDIEPLGSAEVGAARCRLTVMKNQNPADHPDLVVGEGRNVHPNVVLDLDLWELLPKTLPL